MRDLLRIISVLAQIIGQFRELLGRFLCHAFDRLLWLEQFGIVEGGL
jgi:hypothetical protein